MLDDTTFAYTVPAEDREAVRILRDAARYIEAHGWCQGSYGGGGGPACMVGAIVEVQGDSRVLRLLVSYLGRAASRFNDRRGRTKEEVITALESCADWLLAGRAGR